MVAGLTAGQLRIERILIASSTTEATFGIGGQRLPVLPFEEALAFVHWVHLIVLNFDIVLNFSFGGRRRHLMLSEAECRVSIQKRVQEF